MALKLKCPETTAVAHSEQVTQQAHQRASDPKILSAEHCTIEEINAY